jgi:hypothetical protein
VLDGRLGAAAVVKGDAGGVTAAMRSCASVETDRTMRSWHSLIPFKLMVDQESSNGRRPVTVFSCGYLAINPGVFPKLVDITFV